MKFAIENVSHYIAADVVVEYKVAGRTRTRTPHCYGYTYCTHRKPLAAATLVVDLIGMTLLGV